MPNTRVTPDPEHFLIREQDGLRLITPKSSAAFDDQIWNPDNLHFRSRVESLDGETVSQGFKKFMNLGQGPDGVRVDTAAVVAACARGDAVATLKIDGSLIVRSVYQGRIILRTRGSFGYEHQDNAFEIEKCAQRYPRLLDPSYRTDSSLLLEWVSPTNVIIFKYDQAELVLDGTPVDGEWDFEFTLWGTLAAGPQIGPTLTFDGVGGNPPPVTLTNGVFTVVLDFGSDLFTGDARWLQIAARDGASTGAFTTLNPRVELTPAPHAIFSTTAGS